MEFIELILITKLDGVLLKYPHQENIEGTLSITGHHLILSSRKEGVKELWLLYKNIDSIEKKEYKQSGGSFQGGSLCLKCKDLKIYQLEINTTRELSLVTQSLENLSRISDPRLDYPFFYRAQFNMIENGYNVFGIESEFTKVLATDEWRISRVNINFSVCSSYPKTVVVPKSIDDDCLLAAAAFRQGGRFPVLAYRHNNCAVLLRAGQPLYGSKHRRCRQDERILNCIVSEGSKGVIYDLRSSNLIAHQQGKGGGTESNSNYSQFKIYNRAMDDIDNNQALLESFSKFIESCNDRDISSDKWLSRLDAGGWLENVRNSLHTACIIAQQMHQKMEPVLIHGTKGEDATLLISSLVQVILNPDCRTIRGLQALIEREWLQGGHPFQSRHRSGPYASAPHHSAGATFVLFLDCVRQFLHQFPCSFEFLQTLLIKLFEHSYASEFGTFIGDNDEEREKLGVYEQTTSLWSFLNRPHEMELYINPLYEPSHHVIWPSVAPMTIIVWEELYLRWSIKQRLKEREVKIREIKQREKDLRNEALRLRKELLSLSQEIKGKLLKKVPC